VTVALLVVLAAAFAGGAFGAAVGALPAFVLTGALVVAGEAVALAGGGPALTDLAFGPVFGPQASFAGGAAAAAFAARRGDLAADGGVHPAKRITVGLGTSPAVLAVGGLFGAAGHAVTVAATELAVPVDPVAAGVVGSALLHRLLLGYDLLGDLDPRALARSDGRAWLPYQTRWRDVTAVGVAAGGLGGYAAHATGSAFLAFGASAALLAFLVAGVERVPVTHHVTLPASTAVVALGGAPLGSALAAGATFGAVGALLGELAQRGLYEPSATHLDPPAASIVCTTGLVALLAAVGVLPGSAWV
jgi:hypothetical protein